MWMWFITSRAGRAIAAAGAVLLAILTFGASQRRKGAQAAKQKAKEADHARAKEIRESVDEAMRGLDADTRSVDERLRSKGGLRD